METTALRTKEEIIESLKSGQSQMEKINEQRDKDRAELFEVLYTSSPYKIGQKVKLEYRHRDGPKHDIVFIGKCWLSIYELKFKFFQCKKDGSMSLREYHTYYGDDHKIVEIIEQPQTEHA